MIPSIRFLTYKNGSVNSVHNWRRVIRTSKMSTSTRIRIHIKKSTITTSKAMEPLIDTIRKKLPEIIRDFNEVRLPALEIFNGRPFRDEFTTETTDSVTKVLCRGVNNAFYRSIRAELPEFTELATKGSDWMFGDIPIEDKNSFSDANAWTGNGFDKTGWHLLKKFKIDQDGRIIAAFVGLVDITKCSGCWSDKTMTSNFSSLKFACEDLQHIAVIHGDLRPKKKWLAVVPAPLL